MYMKSFFINLDERIDRAETFKERTKNFSLNIERFSAIKLDVSNNDNYNDPLSHTKIACTLSHKKIIEYCIKNNIESVLIFEDDCFFVDEFEKKFNIVLNELKTINDFDILYLGGEPNDICIPFTKILIMLLRVFMVRTHILFIIDFIIDY
jgi:GR25 family glycosyltransferase involved in LPS biosynthesis